MIERLRGRVSGFDVDRPLSQLVDDIRATLSAGHFSEEFTTAVEDCAYVLDSQDDARQPHMPAGSRDDHAAQAALTRLEELLTRFLGEHRLRSGE